MLRSVWLGTRSGRPSRVASSFRTLQISVNSLQALEMTRIQLCGASTRPRSLPGFLPPPPLPLQSQHHLDGQQHPPLRRLRQHIFSLVGEVIHHGRAEDRRPHRHRAGAHDEAKEQNGLATEGVFHDGIVAGEVDQAVPSPSKGVLSLHVSALKHLEIHFGSSKTSTLMDAEHPRSGFRCVGHCMAFK